MVYDLVMKVKDLGDVYGSFIKSTTNSVYLSNVLINKCTNVVISLFKIEKKYIISVSRMAAPSFEKFTDDELASVIAMNNPKYTAAVQKILDDRKANSNENSEVANIKDKVANLEISKPVQQKKIVEKPKKESNGWNQLEANEKLFGIKSEFDMDEYALPIDRNAVGYKELEAKSQMIAKEILSKSSKFEHSKVAVRETVKHKGNDDEMFSTVKATSNWDDLNAKAVPEIKTQQLTKETVELTKNEPKQKVDVKKAEPKLENAAVSPEKHLELDEYAIAIEAAKAKCTNPDGSVSWSSCSKLLALKKRIAEAAENLKNQAVMQDAVQVKPLGIETHKSKEPTKLEVKSDSSDSSNKSYYSKKSTNGHNDYNKNKSNKERRNNNNKKYTDYGKPLEKKSYVPFSGIKFKSADECFNTIIRGFQNNKRCEKKKTWGSGPSIKEYRSFHAQQTKKEFLPEDKMKEINKLFSKEKSQYK